MLRFESWRRSGHKHKKNKPTKILPGADNADFSVRQQASRTPELATFVIHGFCLFDYADNADDADGNVNNPLSLFLWADERSSQVIRRSAAHSPILPAPPRRPGGSSP